MKEFNIYGIERIGYLEDRNYLGKNIKGKNVNLVPLSVMKTLPTMPPSISPLPSIPTFTTFLGGIGSSLVSVYYGKKRYELTDWLGNVRVVVSDKIVQDNVSGNVVLNYKPEVLSVRDYYAYGSEINERTFEPIKPKYRYGFNTQEKVFEINKDHYTARYWEYDSRLGRRWNVDPKGKDFESSYLVFSGNPILVNDILGDTTYIYSTGGQYMGVILDKLKSNEIVLMSEETAKFIFTMRKLKASEDFLGMLARDPNIAEARITSNTLESLFKNYTNSKYENSGLLYVDSKTKEVQVAVADKNSMLVIGSRGEADPRELAVLEKKLGKDTKIIGYWHTHPESTFEGSQESTDDLYGGGYVDALQNGGIGIIVTEGKATLYPLWNFEKKTIPQINDRPKDKNVFPSDHHHAVINKNITPQYTQKQK